MAPLNRSKSASQADQLQIQHFIHQHPLHKLFMTSEFNCDGCNTGGCDVRYRCSTCDFDLHEQCAVASHRISSSHLHPHHNLILVNRPRDSHMCHVCKGATNGLSYTCECLTCEFNVHILCVQVAVSTNEVSNHISQPVLINHQQQPMRVNHQQPMMVNHQQMQTMQFGGYNNQTHMIKHHQQQQQGLPMTGFAGGYNHQPVMVNHHHQQPKQGVPTMVYGGYQGINNNQNQMINHHQQGMPATGFGGFNGGMSSQSVMVNNNQQQQLITNHHQQLQQQQRIQTAVGGYNVVNNNQTVMINQPQPQQQQSNGYAKVGKLAANILSASIIGVPLFNSRN